jgi:hypothetical protein
MLRVNHGLKIGAIADEGGCSSGVPLYNDVPSTPVACSTVLLMKQHLAHTILHALIKEKRNQYLNAEVGFDIYIVCRLHEYVSSTLSADIFLLVNLQFP